MPDLAITELTTGVLDGTGVFDKLMSAHKAHLESEFNKGRIKATEYATVYLGSLDAVMQGSMAFLVQSKKLVLEQQLLEQQVILAGIEVQKANIALQILESTKLKTAAEVLQVQAQTSLITQQTANSVIEGTVLTAQECKLRAEYDLTVNTNLKTTSEIALVSQKIATEKAQVMAMGVDDDSVVGRQKLLYKAQTDGFSRDAEQKVAGLMVGTWNTRRLSDDAVQNNMENMLHDSVVGRAVTKLLSGINA